jgi:hypothetical protein
MTFRFTFGLLTKPFTFNNFPGSGERNRRIRLFIFNNFPGSGHVVILPDAIGT